MNDQSLQLKLAKLVVDRRSRFKLPWFNTVQVPMGRFLVPSFLQKRIQRPNQDNRWLIERTQAMRDLVSSPSGQPPQEHSNEKVFQEKGGMVK